MSGNKPDTAPLSTWIDPDDAPDLSSPEWVEKFARADMKAGDKVIRRGRPPALSPKISTTVRLSPDVLAAFRATGRGWQGRMDQALRDWLKTGSDKKGA